MTQALQKEIPTRAFVDMKAAVSDAIKIGLKEYRQLEVMDWHVKVLRSDPTGPSQIPAIAISRASDGEVNQSIGDLFGYVSDPDIDSVVKKFGTDFRETLEIRIWTSNSDQRDLLYQLVKAILFNYRHYLALKYGLVNQNIIGGRDEANHQMYESHAVYWGVIMFQAENAIQRNILVSRIGKVDASLREPLLPSVLDTSDV